MTSEASVHEAFMAQFMNALHTEAFEISGSGSPVSHDSPDSPGIVRLCGGCSVGHCPECGNQLLPSSLSKTTEAESGATGACEQLVCCQSCKYETATTATGLGTNASPSSTAAVCAGKSPRKVGVTFDVDGV